MQSDEQSRAAGWPVLAAGLLLTAIVVALAVLQVRGWDGTVNGDGVSYLDLASRYAEGRFGAIANGYWSPLYPMLLGLVQRMARAVGSDMPEMQVVLATNLGIFAGASLAFVRLEHVLSAQPTSAGIVVRVMRALVAAALCVWCLLRMIGATTVTPDALLAAWLLLASADIVAATMQEPSAWRHWRFGIVLGLGFWTKAVFLPVAGAALFAYVIATPASARRRATTGVLLPLFVSAFPLVAIQSWTQGRPSFGETGRLNYGWYIGLRPHAPPVSEPAMATVARVRRGDAAPVALTSMPGAVLYTAGTEGSFPYWYDASRYEPRSASPFSLDSQLMIGGVNLHWLRLTAGTFTLFALVGAAAASARGSVRPRRLLATVPPVTMLALYILTHPEGRLGAAAVSCIVLVLVHLADAGSPGTRRPLAGIETIALLVLVAVAVGRTIKRIPIDSPAVTRWPTSAALRAAGVERDASIALAGSPFGQLWAHEAGVHIAAVMPAADAEHLLSDSTMRGTLAESAARGVSLAAVVWNGDASGIAGAVPLAPGWWALPAHMNAAARATAPAAPRTIPPPHPAARAAAASRRATGPAVRP